MGGDRVVLGFAAVQGLHRQGVAQDEREAFGRAQGGEPGPCEHTLDGDHECGGSRCLPERVPRHLSDSVIGEHVRDR